MQPIYYWLPHLQNFHTNNIHIDKLEKLFSIEDRGQTDCVTALPCSNSLDSTAATGLGHAKPHASPHWHAADDATIKTYHYGLQSVLTRRHSRYSCSTHTFILILIYDLDFQSPMSYGHDPPIHVQISRTKVSSFKRLCGNKWSDNDWSRYLSRQCGQW